MREVCNNLYVGTERSCFRGKKQDWAVIHACKSPCHQRRLSYTGSLSPLHPNYLILEEEDHLYLNMVDANNVEDRYGDPMFTKAINFLEKNLASKKIIIHCNQGQSRSPAIALVFLAKTGIIPKLSYGETTNAFHKIYPNYMPGMGVNNYLLRNWQRLVN